MAALTCRGDGLKEGDGDAQRAMSGPAEPPEAPRTSGEDGAANHAQTVVPEAPFRSIVFISA